MRKLDDVKVVFKECDPEKMSIPDLKEIITGAETLCGTRYNQIVKLEVRPADSTAGYVFALYYKEGRRTRIEEYTPIQMGLVCERIK